VEVSLKERSGEEQQFEGGTVGNLNRREKRRNGLSNAKGSRKQRINGKNNRGGKSEIPE